MFEEIIVINGRQRWENTINRKKSTRSHSVENSFWKRLLTNHKTDYGMNERVGLCNILTQPGNLHSSFASKQIE
jgi:sugar diacid utilization regulator